MSSSASLHSPDDYHPNNIIKSTPFRIVSYVEVSHVIFFIVGAPEQSFFLLHVLYVCFKMSASLIRNRVHSTKMGIIHEGIS